MNTVVSMSTGPASTDPNARSADSAPAAADTRPPPVSERSRSHRSQSRTEAAASATYSPFVPLLLGGLALLGWLGFQTQQLLADRDALAAAHASQQQTVDNAGKLRASLDALAADTQRMALAGNPSAKLLVNELAKRGVTINPSGGAAAPSASPTVPTQR